MSYLDLRKAVQEAYDKEIITEYEKRERMVQRVVELEREISMLMSQQKESMGQTQAHIATLETQIKEQSLVLARSRVNP